jgi:hypothetical protein
LLLAHPISRQVAGEFGRMSVTIGCRPRLGLRPLIPAELLDREPIPAYTAAAWLGLPFTEVRLGGFERHANVIRRGIDPGAHVAVTNDAKAVAGTGPLR